MSSKDDKCLVCLKAGRNLNIFTTYNVRNTKDKEELYVDVIKNCYNIEISPNSGLTALCNECSMKLKKAYNFRHEILQAIEKLITAQAEVTNNKLYSEIEYLEDIPFDADYDIDTVLDSETGQISYALNEIYDGKEINANDEPNCLFHLDNDAVVDKVLFNNSNDNVSEIIQNNGLDIEKAGSDLDLEPAESYLLDKPVENYSIDILSDILVDNDLEPGEIRVIDKIDKHYLIDAHNDVIVDKKKVIIKSIGKINTNDNNVVKTVYNQEAGPVDIVDKIPEIDEKNEASKGNIDKKPVTRKRKNKDKTVLSQAEILVKSAHKQMTNNLIKGKRKVCKRVKKENKDELSLLARICTEQPNPDENTEKDKTVLNQAETAVKFNTNDLIKDKKKVCKRVKKENKDELSLLARICTEQPNPDENTEKDKTVLNQAETSVKFNTNDLIKDKKKVCKRVKKENKDELSLLARICTEQPNPDETTEKDKTVLNQAETSVKFNTNDLIKDKKKVCKRVKKENNDELSLLARICTEQPNPDENTEKDKTVLNQAETSVKFNTNDLIKDKKKVCKRVKKEKKDELSLLARICTEQPNPDENTEKDKTVLNQAETSVKFNTNDLIKDKKKVCKRVKKENKDELSLLARICTEQPNPDENTVNEINEQKAKDDATNLVATDVGDKNASKKRKSKKRRNENAGKKEASVKENQSGNVKAKRPRKEKKEKTPPPFTLQPDQTACDVCPARFETTWALSVHMNTHYPKYVCGECGLEHANKNRLRQHQRTHDQGPFLCKVCDKQFSNSNTRNAHTWRVHSKGDPFKCRHCGMRFPTYLQRLRHVQSAHGETPKYACQFCEAKFSYAAYRSKHIRTVHLDERPHQCRHCPAAFARARVLASHLASKHGEGKKSYRCPLCGVSFYFRNALRWHVSLHRHKFPCNQCDQKFATSAELESHTQIHEHADNMAINLDFVTSLHLDALADDYALIDPSYLDLNEL